MAMIDVWAPEGTFADPQDLARELSATLMALAAVPASAIFRRNTATVVHLLPRTAIANVDGDSDCVRVQVLTSPGLLARSQQLAVVEKFTDIVGLAAGRPEHGPRVWVLLTEAAEGGWGVDRHAHTSEELTAAVRDQRPAAALQNSTPTERS